ncbi:conjugal transfer protein [Vibrio maritimus]|uniref:conjugal transfer protein n=1 Tax=Vibrio maritimus TaxID=990268 RepID=UPI001F43C3E7|nr:conjugal transfer protein [Vibrio maritimus]
MTPFPLTPTANEPVEDESPVNPHALLRSERNRLYILCVVLALSVSLALVFCFFAFQKAQNNKELIYVKLAPNGSWSVVDYQPDDSQLYFKTTIDALLTRFAISRYGVTPATIADDWAEAKALMAPSMAAHFVSPNGFNAIEKAASLAKSRDNITIHVRNIEHYDQVTATDFSGQSRTRIRSNVYFSRERSAQHSESLVLSLQWQLMDKRSLSEESMSFLRLNPIGLQITDAQLNIERQ